MTENYGSTQFNNDCHTFFIAKAFLFFSLAHWRRSIFLEHGLKLCNNSKVDFEHFYSAFFDMFRFPLLRFPLFFYALLGFIFQRFLSFYC